MKSPFIVFLIVVYSLCADARPHKQHKMAPKDELLAYWNMEQNPVLFQIHDQSGNGNHLTGSAGAILTEGKIGNAVEVGGGSTLKLASNAGVSHQGGRFTVAFWFKPTVLTTPLPIAGDPEGQWIVQMEASGPNFFLRARINPDDIDATVDITAVPLVVGEWYWVALGWYDNNGSFAWATVNLSDRVRVAAAGPLAEPTNPPIFWNPNIFDEVAIWGRNVPADELRAIYNKAKGLPFEEWDAPDDCRKIDCCD